MRKVLIATHSTMASGIKDTLKFLTTKDIDCICAYVDSNLLQDQICTFMNTRDNNDDLIILTDMLGGSVNQAFCSYMDERTHVICGINLPLALSILLYPQENELTKEKIKELIEESRKQILYMNEYEVVCEEEDE